MFQYPLILIIGFWTIPVLAALLIVAHRRRMRAAARFADPVMGRRLMPMMGGARPWVRGTMLLAALALLIVAGARPRFGTEEITVTREGVDLMVCLDVSRSMLAEDVSPSRLEEAKDGIRDLIAALPGERYGLVVFAGAPSMKAPLTGDRAFFLERLDEVGPHSAPRGGTDIHSALVKAIGSLKEVEGRDRAIVLITDGENLEDNDPMAAARAAAAKDIKIFTIGLGNTTDGARIPLRTEGNLQYLKESDQEVWSKTDGKLLAQLAEVTGGDSLIIGPGDYYDFADFEQDFLLNMQRGALDETLKARKIDRYQWFLGFAVALLLIHPIVPETRRREEESRIVGYQS